MKLEPIQTGILSVSTYIVPLAGNAVFIVDPAGSGYTSDENLVTDYLEANDFIPLGIFLTHGHFDHIPGIKPLKEKFPFIKIGIHENDRDCIGPESQTKQKIFMAGLGDELGRLLEPVFNLPPADVLFTDGLSFDKIITDENIISAYKNSGKEISLDQVEQILKSLSQWKIISTPGHTKGSCCFYNDAEKVLISGDTVFYGSYGRTDLYGGSDKEIQESISKIFKSVSLDAKVYPGHGSFGFTLLNSGL